MSQVTIEVGGRTYTLACAEGEEAQVMRLGRVIDDRVRSITGGRPGSETQSLLFAALMLADELQDGGSAEADDNLAASLEAFADRLEKCASALEGRLGTS